MYNIMLCNTPLIATPTGTLTVLSLMVGTVTENLAPDENFLINGTNLTIEVDVTARDLRRVQVAAATTVLAGLIQVRHQSFLLTGML